MTLLDRDDLNTELAPHPRPGRAATGIILALPVSLALWALLIWRLL